MVQVICSTAAAPLSQALEELLSPPRGWPASFKDNPALRAFLNNIQGKKARLTGPPPPAIADEAAAVELDLSVAGVEHDSGATSAERVFAALGWAKVTGFAIYESKVHPDVFIAREQHWNCHPQNIWVDLTPRPAAHSQVLLVQADVAAASARAQVSKAALTVMPTVNAPVTALASGPGAVVTAQSASAANVASAASSVGATAAAVAGTTPLEAVAPPDTSPSSTPPVDLTDMGSKAPPEGDAPAMSYDDILASISLGPKGTAKKMGLWVPAPAEDEAEESFFHAQLGQRQARVGEPGNERAVRVPWPGKNAQVRMKLLRDCTFELEARCWGVRKAAGGKSQDDELIAELWGGEVPWFAPPEYGDPDAALLKAGGRFIRNHDSNMGKNGNRFERIKMDWISEERNGTRKPPLTKDDVYAICGPSLLNGLETSWRGDTQFSVKMDRLTDWFISFRQDFSGWA